MPDVPESDRKLIDTPLIEAVDAKLEGDWKVCYEVLLREAKQLERLYNLALVQKAQLEDQMAQLRQVSDSLLMRFGDMSLNQLLAKLQAGNSTTESRQIHIP